MSGFTLIELLVVMAIIALLAGAGIAAYSKFNKKRQVEQAAMNFASFVRTQQKRADAGEVPSTCTPNTFTGFTVEVILNNSAALSKPVCNNPTTENFDLGGGKKFADSFSVIFNLLGIAPTFGPGEGETIVSDLNNAYKYLVALSAGGTITVEEQP